MELNPYFRDGSHVHTYSPPFPKYRSDYYELRVSSRRHLLNMIDLMIGKVVLG
jgi:hypothetical protein